MAVQTAAGDLTLQVSWGELPEAGSWQNAINVVLRLRGLRGFGQIERIFSEEGGSARERHYQAKALDVQIQVETQDQNLSASALALAETIRGSLHRSDVALILTDAGLALASQGGLRLADWTDAHRRRRSGAIWDLVFNASTDIAGPLVPWMASFVYTGDLGGSTLGPTEIVLP